MVTSELEASTLEKYEVSASHHVKQRGYCYFLFQENPQIATQSNVIIWPSNIPRNYLCSVRGNPESTTVFLTADVIQQTELPSLDVPIYDQIMLFAGNFYTIQTRIQPNSYNEIFDTVSTYTPRISTYEPKIEKSTLNIFEAYEHQEFDTDIVYEYTNALDRLIRVNGKPVIKIINNIITKHVFDNDLVSETLKALGRIEDENTKNERYELLIGLIKNDAAIIRDGAVSGLSFLDDKRALSQLRILFETETITILKNNIRVAIKGLETY